MICTAAVCVSRGTPILAGGIGVARLVVGAVSVFVFGYGAVGISASERLATVLDAAQRLEQKKSWLCLSVECMARTKL